MISYTATAADLRDKTKFPTFHRVTSSDTQLAEMIVQTFVAFNYRKVGVIHIDDGFGNSLKNEILSFSESHGIRVRAYAFSSSASGQNLANQLRAALRAIVAEQINVIFFTGLVSEVDWYMAEAADELNWVHGKLYLGIRNFIGDIVRNAPKPELVKRFLHGSLNLVRGYNRSSPEFESMKAHWPHFNVSDVQPAFPVTKPNGPNYTVPLNFFTNAVDIHAPRYFAFPYAYDSIVAIGLASCGPNQTLLQNLRTVEFNGVSGRIKLDQNLDRAAETTMIMMQNVLVDDDSVSLVEVARADGHIWTFTEPITFNDGSDTPPSDVDSPENMIDLIPPGAQAFGWILTVLAIGFTLLIAILVLRQRSSPIFKESQPLVLGLLLLGCGLMGGSIAALINENTDGCMTFPWLFGLGFTLCLACLIAKSIAIASRWSWLSSSRGKGSRRGDSTQQRGDTAPLLTENSSTVIMEVSQVKLVFLIAVLLAVEVALLIAWQVIAPLTSELSVSQQDAEGHPLHSSIVCTNSSEQTTTFFALAVAYMCVLVVFALAVSIWIRNAPDQYQEAKMTAVAGLFMFQVFFIAIPTAAVVWGNALPRFLVLACLTFILCLIVLFTMFVPKIYKLRFTASQPSASENRSPHNLPERETESTGMMMGRRIPIAESSNNGSSTGVKSAESNKVVVGAVVAERAPLKNIQQVPVRRGIPQFLQNSEETSDGPSDASQKGVSDSREPVENINHMLRNYSTGGRGPLTAADAASVLPPTALYSQDGNDEDADALEALNAQQMALLRAAYSVGDNRLGSQTYG